MALVRLHRSPDDSDSDTDSDSTAPPLLQSISEAIDAADTLSHSASTTTITSTTESLTTNQSTLKCHSPSISHTSSRRDNSHHHHHRLISENYFVVKDAALLLPKCNSKRSHNDMATSTGDILKHLHSMATLVRPQDTIILAIRLSSYLTERIRYLVIIETEGKQDTEENALLGFDINGADQRCTIGLVLPIYSHSVIMLDGDGGFRISSNDSVHLFKPVSIQAMWSACQYLYKAFDTARKHNYYSSGLNHDWLHYYAAQKQSEQALVNEWNQMEERSAERDDATSPYFDILKFVFSEKARGTGDDCASHDPVHIYTQIREKIKEIMANNNDEYGSMNSLAIRRMLEKELGRNLDAYKKFIEASIFQFYNQFVECASKILPYLYLGTEWNASHYDQLVSDGVTHILNVSCEVDNFFQDAFKYLNIRVLDVDEADLLKEFDRAFKFIAEAKEQGSSCLVHCKMGVSRSASTVIAYVMKERNMGRDEALQFVKERRSCIKPNKSFMSQLATYESILNAHRSKYNLFEPLNCTSSSNFGADFDTLRSGMVKEAINRIKKKSTSTETNIAAPPSSPATTFYISSPPKSVEKSGSKGGAGSGVAIRRCQSMKFRELPKLNELKRTPSCLNENEASWGGKNLFGDELSSNSSVKKLAEDFMNANKGSGSPLEADLSNNADFVPLGIVKRQVESINFKSRPCTPEDLCSSPVNEASSSDGENTVSVNVANSSPDSKRFKIEALVSMAVDESADESVSLSQLTSVSSSVSMVNSECSLNKKSSNQRSKKVFEFLADKMRGNDETTSGSGLYGTIANT